jgi:hypothetical protein
MPSNGSPCGLPSSHLLAMSFLDGTTVASAQAMSRIALPAWLSGRGHGSPALSRHFLVAMVLVLALIAAALLWTKWGGRSEPRLDQLPAADRRALYERTRADLELCASGAGAALADHCAHQAELIVAFPECEASCQSLAGRWRSTPTR